MESVLRKSVLITDLDNTLFDWVEMWYQSFSAMFQKIIEKTGLDEDELKSEIRDVHQKHGTSEYAFLLEEVPSLVRFANGKSVTEVFQDAIYAYRIARKRSLVLYPSVKETLQFLRNSDCFVVGYTESMAFYTGYRVRKLGLDGVIQYLFSPEDHDLPQNMSREEIRRYPAERYNFEQTIHKHTPKGELKPNPDILREIVQTVGSSKGECVYVGDSLHKDIAMAKDAGVDHAWAAYGRAQERPEYQLLRDVTHWTDEDVQRERDIKQRDVKPQHTLHYHFGEITKIFTFQG